MTRFDAASNPFSNPFSSQTAAATPSGAAPAGKVAAAPLPPASSVASAVPSASAAAPTGGSAKGWTASGGSPVVVGQGETLDTLSRRYGVPSAALLSANGLAGASDVKSGMHLVVPVYSAGGQAVASAASKAESKVKVAANDAEPGKSKKKDKTEAKDGKDAKEAKDKKDTTKVADKSRPETKAADAADKTAPQVVAKAEPTKPTAAGKKGGIDTTPTGNVDPKAAEAKTAEQADASGTSPEFRWPARGRIIEGFKAGGNDGINISVPAGTSVRAAESGVVVYSGDGLKGYGNLVLIKHPNGYVTAYANNGELDVKRGEAVKRGQVIAKSGDSGNVNAPQLHFELRKGSTPVDPTQYLAGL